MVFGAWRASRKRESGGPEVQVGGVKTAKGSPEMGRGARKQGKGGSGLWTARKWKLGSSSSDNCWEGEGLRRERRE